MDDLIFKIFNEPGEEGATAGADMDVMNFFGPTKRARVEPPHVTTEEEDDMTQCATTKVTTDEEIDDRDPSTDKIDFTQTQFDFDFPETQRQTIAQRREEKAAARRHQTRMGKPNCHGCQIPFWSFADKEHRLCHNCVKIVGAIESQV